MKLSFINSYEEKLCKDHDYEIIRIEALVEALQPLLALEDKDSYLFLAQYHAFLNGEFVEPFAEMKKKLENNEGDSLKESQAQEYFMSELFTSLDGKIQNLALNTGSSYGRPWTQLQIGRKDVYTDSKEEFIFWSSVQDNFSGKSPKVPKGRYNQHGAKPHEGKRPS